MIKMSGTPWTQSRKNDWSKRMTGSGNPIYGTKRPKYIIDAIRKINLGKPSVFKGHHHSKKSLSVLSIKATENWKRGIYTTDSLKKWFVSNNIGITNPEAIIGSILYSNFPDFVFTGNGKFFINRFCPDFVNTRKKVIIEVYGKYWHSKPKKIEKDQRRLRQYKIAGFKVLILHETEIINNIDMCINKITRLMQ